MDSYLSLSSLSVVFNSTAAVILEDIVKGCFNLRPSPKVSTIIVKGSILVLGVLSMCLLVVVEKLNGIFVLATSLSAIAAGTTFGVFSLGMLIPWSNTAGAISGVIAGALMSGWISFGSQTAVAAGYVTPNKLGVWIDQCPAATNQTLDLIVPEYADETNVFPLYRLSFHWINPIGILTVIVVGTIVSFVTGPQKLDDIDPELISPIIHKFLPRKCFENYGMKSSCCERRLSNQEVGVEMAGMMSESKVNIQQYFDYKHE